MTKCEECGSRRVKNEREDVMGFIAFCIALLCTGALVSFAFISDFGFEFMEMENVQRYHMWVSYMTLGPLILALVGFAGWVFTLLYITMVWLELRK